MNALALGNSGRGVNESSLDAARKIYEVRTKVDQFFDGYGPEQVVFTSGITESLNTVIKGSLNHGDHVITTFMEHNSVLRPLYEMERQGVCLTITSPDVGDIKQAITKDTKMIVMTHASNVTGEMFDIQSVGKLCREKGILFVVDTAQSAGVIPISMKEDNIDILCFTGHKGLMGPQGIGGICIRKGVEIRPLKTGGTGILSFSKTQPEALPQALEAGTLNGIGIAGLGAAIDHINTYGINKIRKQEKNLIETFYKKMKEMGYPLDYLNIEYNIDEANKKIKDCLERTKMLNLEDNLFELKVLNDYFDSVFNDFENERIGRKDYEEINQKFYSRLVKMNNAIREIKLQIGDLEVSYNLSSDDIETLNNIAESLKNLNDDYQILINHTSNNVFAYSKLIKEIENLNYRLINLENNLDSSLDTIGNMREDEARAREQLEEIKIVMRKAKVKIHEYNLPIVPDIYQTELKEAMDAVKEIVKELEQKPITIDILNTRVDTARDLALKVLRRSEEISRCAHLAEMAIVYGNRYRPVSPEVNRQLNYSENLYYKGEYKKSLELTANMLERIEPGIYNRLVKKYVQ